MQGIRWNRAAGRAIGGQRGPGAFVMSKVAILIGSLRRGSFSRSIANAALALAPEGIEARIVEIGDLPMYNEDIEADPPEVWRNFRAAVAGMDGILFVTPEYNRSIPGCLKNAIDVGSRPPNQSVWKGKRAGVISVTPYKLGAFGANHALRQTLVFLDMPAMQQPEAYISNVQDLLDDAGGLANEDTRRFLTKFMQAFARWVES
jgi:NAD(P)H-dependent FMN reductase